MRGRGAPLNLLRKWKLLFACGQKDTGLMIGPDFEKSIKLKAATNVRVAGTEAIKSQLSSSPATLGRFSCFHFYQIYL